MAPFFILVLKINNTYHYYLHIDYIFLNFFISLFVVKHFFMSIFQLVKFFNFLTFTHRNLISLDISF